MVKAASYYEANIQASIYRLITTGNNCNTRILLLALLVFKVVKVMSRRERTDKMMFLCLQAGILHAQCKHLMAMGLLGQRNLEGGYLPSQVRLHRDFSSNLPNATKESNSPAKSEETIGDGQLRKPMTLSDGQPGILIKLMLNKLRMARVFISCHASNYETSQVQIKRTDKSG